MRPLTKYTPIDTCNYCSSTVYSNNYVKIIFESDIVQVTILICLLYVFFLFCIAFLCICFILLPCHGE